MLMPGAAFDRHRNRLGYGKGFYDRFLLSLICPHIFLQDSPWNRQDAPP